MRSPKEGQLHRLRQLLEEVPGTATPWDEIEEELRRRLSAGALRGLAYRIERQLEDTFDKGQRVQAGVSRPGVGDASPPPQRRDAGRKLAP